MTDQERLAEYQWVLQVLRVGAESAPGLPDLGEFGKGYQAAWRTVAAELSRLILPPITEQELYAQPHPPRRWVHLSQEVQR